MADTSMVIRVAANLAELKKNLAEGKIQIETTTSAMEKLATSFSGDRLIQQAMNVTAAIDKIGGITKLTEAEQARVNDVLDRALEKYAALGREAPAGMQQLADATKDAANRTKDVHGAFQAFDGVLGAFGIHIGAEVKGIEDIADASGKSATELGKLATAGLVVGAAIGGWKIGRMIADFFDLDEKISNATAKLLGFGDVAAEVAGAKQDVITRAIERGADASITYAAALKFNTEWFKEHKKAAKEDAEALAEWQTAMIEVNSAGDGWRGTLETINGTVVEAIKYYLDAGVSQESLAKAYDLTATQVKAVAAALKEEIAQQQLATTASKEYWGTVGTLIDQVLGEDNLRKATAWVDAIKTLGGSIDTLSNDDLAQLRQAMLGGIDALSRMGQLTTQQSSDFAALAAAVDRKTMAVDDTVAADARLRQALYDEAVAQDAALAKLREANDEQERANDLKQKALDVLSRGNVSFGGTPIDDAYIQAHQFDPAFQLQQLQAEIRNRQGIAGIPGRATGGPVSAGQPYIVGERRPELFVPESNGSILPSVGGTAVTFAPGSIVLNYPVMNDPTALRHLTDMLSAGILTKLTGSGMRIASGA